MDFDYNADVLLALSDKLKQFDSTELTLIAHTLTNVGVELRKQAPRLSLVEKLNKLKPEPPRSDPNSKIPRPVTPPKGSGPVKLALAPGLNIQV
jgi:hypothetical protein